MEKFFSKTLSFPLTLNPGFLTFALLPAAPLQISRFSYSCWLSWLFEQLLSSLWSTEEALVGPVRGLAAELRQTKVESMRSFPALSSCQVALVQPRLALRSVSPVGRSRRAWSWHRMCQQKVSWLLCFPVRQAPHLSHELGFEGSWELQAGVEAV